MGDFEFEWKRVSEATEAHRVFVDGVDVHDIH